jgi:hypothetical protein
MPIKYERYLAYFDFIGFRNWILTEGSESVYKRVVYLLGLAVKGSLPNSIVNPDMSVTLRRSRVLHSNFSDTIIFYTTNTSYAAFCELLKTCAHFIALALDIHMVRGAITHGSFYVFPEDNIHIGEALIDAYDLAEDQDWIGVALHEKMKDDPNLIKHQRKYSNCLVNYSIPFKNSWKNGICVNWIDKNINTWSFSPINVLMECKNKALNSAQGNVYEQEKIKRRIQNTREFLERFNVLSKNA